VGGTGYALTFGSLLLAGGWLSDLFGQRRMLVAGLALFALASLACGLAQWPLMLIVARIIQGGAGALVSPAALSLLTTSNPEGAARNRALSIWQGDHGGRRHRRDRRGRPSDAVLRLARGVSW
jgi:MFS family permease